MGTRLPVVEAAGSVVSALPMPAAASPAFVLGRYEVRERLGEGGMGMVHRGHDPVLDRAVAIKMIGLNMAKDELPDYEARFYQEARAAGGLAHPNIVVIYDIGKTDRHAYMVMEYVEGRELRDLLMRHSPFGYRDAIEVCTQVADGLAYAHARGVVHRDIKPTNIMVTSDGVVKITDFGIARMRTSELKTMTGIVLGSPRYMSPEQVTGRMLDQRTDIFSLGVVLYELLTGRPPFQGDSVQGVMFQALNSAPTPPSKLNPDVPRILDFVVAKAISKDPERRYATADAMAADLRSALGTAAPRWKPLDIASPAASAPSGTPEALSAAAGSASGESPQEASKGASQATLSPAFDSSAATLRLQALSQESAPATPVVHPFPRREPSGMASRAAASPAPGKVTRAAWLWAAAGAALLLAAMLIVR